MVLWYDAVWYGMVTICMTQHGNGMVEWRPGGKEGPSLESALDGGLGGSHW